MLVGLFALSQCFLTVEEIYVERTKAARTRNPLPTLKDLKTIAPTILRAGLTGTFIGIIPGAGGDVYKRQGLGHPGRLLAEPKALAAFMPFIPQGTYWGFTQIGRRNFDMIREALRMGAHAVRIGMEDSPWLSAGQKAERNVEIVRETAALIRETGAKTASPDEIRAQFGLGR